MQNRTDDTVEQNRAQQALLQDGSKKWTRLNFNNFATVSGKNACDMSKVSKCYIEKAHNLHRAAFKYFCLIYINLHNP